MSKVIAEWKDGARPTLLWVDFERYASRVFAGSPVDWYRDPVRFAATVRQAHRVVPSNLVAVDVLAPFFDLLGQDMSDSVTWRSQPPLLRVQALLDEAAPREFVYDVVDALTHALDDDVDLVLKLRSPKDLLVAVGAPAGVVADFATLDEVGTALVGLIRLLSNKAFTCLQVSTDSINDLSADEYDACEPLFRAAEYYGWATCLSFANYRSDHLPQSAAELLLLPELSASRLFQAGDARFGGGLPSAFWLDGDSRPPEALRLLYGVIPEDASPETVAERMRALAGMD